MLDGMIVTEMIFPLPSMSISLIIIAELGSHEMQRLVSLRSPLEVAGMFQRSSLTTVAVLAAGGALIAGCSNSSSSSSSAPASAAAATTSAAATASSAAASAAATGISAADCKIISQVSGSVISTLTPLQSESTSKASAALKAYVATLSADENKLTSAGGKAALNAFINAVLKASTETPSQATGGLETAIGNLGSACSS
jgi:hypothetical protein